MIAKAELMKTKPLTFDDLADIYDKTTGKRARVQPLDKIVRWATHSSLIRYDKEQDLFFKV